MVSSTPGNFPHFSVIIVSLNGGGVIARALDSVLATEYPSFEVIVVDNGSTDNLAEIVKTEYPTVRLIQSPVNLGFAGGNNLGLAQATGDIAVLLNDDTEVRPGWLCAWAKAASEIPNWGVMGCKLLYPDGKTIQHAGGVVESNALTHHIGYEQPDDGRYDERLDVDYATGAALAIRREVVDRIGMLDEGYFPIYFEETDYCWRVRAAGYRIVYIPDCVVLHHESRTQGRFSFKFNYRYTYCRLRFITRCFTREQIERAVRRELQWWSYRFYNYYPGYLAAYAKFFVLLPFALRARKENWRQIDAIVSRKNNV
jgi:GT2 family glycosyltransferase